MLRRYDRRHGSYCWFDEVSVFGRLIRLESPPPNATVRRLLERVVRRNFVVVVWLDAVTGQAVVTREVAACAFSFSARA